MPPLSPQDLLKLSDRGIFQLLRYYQKHKNGDLFVGRDMMGGLGGVKGILCDACSLHPERFVILFTQCSLD